MGHSLLPSEVADYVAREVTRESAVQKRLREETARLPDSRMQISPDQAAVLAMLARLVGARRTLEIGTFTGYSALAVAMTLPADGKLIACDVSEEWTQVARRYWKEANVSELIDLRIAPALQTLDSLLAQKQEGQFDLAFIDADKGSYDAYYERCLRLVRSRGVIALDNMLWSGAVAQRQKDATTEQLDALNRKIRADERVDCALFTVGDGMLVAQKR